MMLSERQSYSIITDWHHLSINMFHYISHNRNSIFKYVMRYFVLFPTTHVALGKKHNTSSFVHDRTTILSFFKRLWGSVQNNPIRLKIKNMYSWCAWIWERNVELAWHTSTSTLFVRFFPDQTLTVWHNWCLQPVLHERRGKTRVHI